MLHLNSCLSQVVDMLSIGLSGFLRIESLIAMRQAQSASLNILHSEKPKGIFLFKISLKTVPTTLITYSY